MLSKAFLTKVLPLLALLPLMRVFEESMSINIDSMPPKVYCVGTGEKCTPLLQTDTPWIRKRSFFASVLPA
jgi:hypothetical protein